MARIKFTERKRFILDQFEILAVLEFTKDLEQKLTEYNFPFAQGVDYEDRGEGPVTFTLNGLLLNFENTGDTDVQQISQLEQVIREQKDKETIQFSHPEIGAFRVKVKSFRISQVAQDEGYKFTLELVKVTKVREVQRTQQSIETEFNAALQVGETEVTIVSGDTLGGIALQIFGNFLLWREIWNFSDNKARSRSKDPNLIFPGEVFKIPILQSQVS